MLTTDEALDHARAGEPRRWGSRAWGMWAVTLTLIDGTEVEGVSFSPPAALAHAHLRAQRLLEGRRDG